MLRDSQLDSESLFLTTLSELSASCYLHWPLTSLFAQQACSLPFAAT